jgi:CHAT domain-containing protein
LFSCSEKREPKYPGFLRDLPHELAHQLVNSNDSTFIDYAREVGFDFLYSNMRLLGRKHQYCVFEHDSLTADEIFSYLFRLCQALEFEYNYPHSKNYCTFLDTLTSEKKHAVAALRMSLVNVVYNPDLTDSLRIKKYLGFVKVAYDLGDSTIAASSYQHLAGLYDHIGDKKKAMQYWYTARSALLKIKAYRSACQVLGVIGSIHASSGQIDSMVIYYEKVREIARRCRISSQAPRMLGFYGGYYHRQGRLSLASEMYHEAIKLCREYKGGCEEIRFIRDAMRFHAKLGSWKAIRPLLKNARLQEKDCRYSNIDSRHGMYLSIEQIEARMKMAQGRVAEAESLFNHVQDQSSHLPFAYHHRKVDYLNSYLYLAIGLLDNNLPDRALPIIYEGLQASKESNEHDYISKLTLLHAKVEYLRGNHKQSLYLLEQFDHVAKDFEQKLKREWIERDVLLGRIRLRNGDLQAAMRALEEGLLRFNGYIMGTDASMQSYLWVSQCDDLRQLAHDLISNDPRLGYGAELYWRDCYRLLGYNSRKHDSREVSSPSSIYLGNDVAIQTAGSLIEDFKSRAESATVRLKELGAIHCIYLVRDDEIWRWTAASNGIRRDVLEASTPGVKELVAKTWEMMTKTSSNRDASISKNLSQNLRRLATILLPSEVLETPSHQTEKLFLITPDEFLGRIPFESFNVGTEEQYLPLLSRQDVAYLRYMDKAPDRTAADPGVIVVNAQISKELDQQYIFQKELSQAHIEAEAAVAIDPHARYLEGDSASKSNLLSSWEDASFIYFASHIFRNPEVPYLMLVPLTPPKATAGPHASYLDLTDIRSADFNKCNLVVLSGCSSGAPYIDAHTAGPSLGDAFLDAGAAAVIQTFWDVRDDDASELMTSFVNTWKKPGFDRIHSLCEIRRRAMQSPQGFRHPSVWAAYAIKVGKL